MIRRERSKRACRLGAVAPLETRALLTMMATAPLPDVSAAAGATVAPVNLDNYFKDANATADYAMVNTSLGTIPVLLTPTTTPLTVANFESYVAKGAYTNSIVHRSVPGFIWQTGGYQLNSSGGATTTATDAPVKNEFGASNVRGTVAMAKLGTDPNSATDQFFFNESDSNASNLDTQNSGFTVFGHVVGAQGLAVMDAVAAVPVPATSPLSSPFDQIPLQNYTSGATVKTANLVLINNVTMANELFVATSDTPGVATASVQGGNLTITPVAGGTAHFTIVGYGSDGNAATQSFAVNVSGTPASTMTTTTPTPTPTSTPTPTPTATTVAQPTPTVASVLVPAARGAVPASVVAGKSAKIGQTVTLTSPSAAVAQKERVTLSLTSTTSSPIAIAGTTTQVKLKAGKPAKVSVSTPHLAASVPAGKYELVVTVTDPSGASTTVDTGKAITVRAAGSKATR